MIYLGYCINRDGIQPVEGSARATHEAPAPTNVKELQAFLGMLNYYDCYLPNLSTVLAPPTNFWPRTLNGLGLKDRRQLLTKQREW